MVVSWRDAVVTNPDTGVDQLVRTTVLIDPDTGLPYAAGGGGGGGDASAAKQDTIIGHLDGVEGSLASILAKIIAAPATEAKQTGPTTGTLSTVAGATSSGTILASNADRKGATVYNDSTAILYLRLSNGAASTSAFTVKILSDSYYEFPVVQGGAYTGAVTGIWSAANGNARVTEFT